MTPEEQNSVHAVIARIPLLHGTQDSVRRLGGLTNRVYQLGEKLVLRMPGQGTEEYINRHNEAESARVAAAAGVSPAVLHVEPETGIMVTALVHDAVTLSPEGFRQRPGAPARAGQVLHKLHTSGGVFPFRFELFAMIDDYLKVLSGKDVALPDGYHAVVDKAQALRAALARHAVPLAPCHCDPLCENFLDDGARMWIVDWEYSGMNDPMWDLGDLSVEAGFSDAQDMELLQAYFAGPPGAVDHARMVVYKAMCDLLWTLWGLIQHANNNPADDFAAYALNRFRRCKALMETPAFAAHVSNLA